MPSPLHRKPDPIRHRLRQNSILLRLLRSIPVEGSVPRLQSSELQTQSAVLFSQVIGIIKRKTLIKELAAVYHAECLTYCRELLELQNKSSEEPFLDSKPPEDSRKEIARPSKRSKKGR
ncbi:hypothetical protein LINGRAHAP2_LOCUS26907 [Linum grandiflorum]